MTRIALCLLFVALAACGGSDAPADTTPATGESAAAADQPAAAGDSAAPAAGLGCDKEVALACADGFMDGCLSKLTLVHVCVAASEEKAGPPPCKMEIARQCPAGQVDACSTTPPQSANHACVVSGK